MSAIASFHILPEEKIPALREAAVPKKNVTEKRGLIFKRKVETTTDNFDNFLEVNGRECPEFNWSGYVFGDLVILADGRKCDLFEAADKDLSDFLSETRGSTFFAFKKQGAEATLAALSMFNLTEDDVRSHLIEEGKDDESADGVEAILAALAQLKGWLSEVREGAIGLLSIG